MDTATTGQRVDLRGKTISTYVVFEGDRELPVLRANGVIRAVPLSPGRHELEFRYRSPPYVLGRAITGLTLLAVVGAAILLRVRARGRAPA